MSTAILLLIAVASVVLGSLIAYFRTPKSGTISLIQHFTAGLVLAAVATELVPGLMAESYLFSLTGGFVCGVAVMLLIKQWTERLGDDIRDGDHVPAGLVTAAGVDIFVDGLLVGASFAVGLWEGIIVTTALLIEIFFLSVSVSSSLAVDAVDRGKAVMTTLGFAAAVTSGIVLGRLLSKDLSGAGYVAFLAFATAALLYLVVEELLVEAHKETETPLATASFFGGFLILILLEGTLSN